MDDQVLGSVSPDYDEDGIFSAVLVTPDDKNLSGEELKITAKIMNISRSQSTTSFDVTSIFQEIRLILDANESQVIALEIDAQGGNQLADGHIWHPGQIYH